MGMDGHRGGWRDGWRYGWMDMGRDGGMGRDVLGGAFGMPSLGEAGVPGAAAPVLCELMIKCGLVLLQCPTRCSRCRIHPSSPVVSKHLSSIPSTTCPCRGTHRCAEQGCAVLQVERIWWTFSIPLEKAPQNSNKYKEHPVCFYATIMWEVILNPSLASTALSELMS